MSRCLNYKFFKKAWKNTPVTKISLNWKTYRKNFDVYPILFSTPFLRRNQHRQHLSLWVVNVSNPILEGRKTLWRLSFSLYKRSLWLSDENTLSEFFLFLKQKMAWFQPSPLLVQQQLLIWDTEKIFKRYRLLLLKYLRLLQKNTSKSLISFLWANLSSKSNWFSSSGLLLFGFNGLE